MPVETHYDATNRTFVHTVKGTLDVDDVADAARAREEHPAHSGGGGDRVIWELSSLDAARFSSDDMRPLIEAVHERRARGVPLARVALVAPTDIGFGVSRMYSSYVEADLPTIRAFRTEDEALAWLAAPDPR